MEKIKEMREKIQISKRIICKQITSRSIYINEYIYIYIYLFIYSVSSANYVICVYVCIYMHVDNI